MPALSIRSKLVIAFVALSTLPVMLVGLYGLSTNISTATGSALADVAHDVRIMRERTGALLSNVRGDLRVLRHGAEVESFVHRTRGGNDAPLVLHVADAFRSLALAKGIYYQLRLLDADDVERVRVAASATDSAPDVRVLLDSALRTGDEGFYDVLTEGLHGDQIAYAPAELSRGGDSEIAVVSFAMPLDEGGRRAGMLVANVFASSLYDLMRPPGDAPAGERVALVEQNGRYIYNSDERRDWNTVIARQQEDNLVRDFPAPVAARILSGSEGIIADETGDIVAYAPLFENADTLRGTAQSTGFVQSPVLLERVPTAAILSPARSFGWTYAALMALFLGLGVVLALMAARQFTRPIEALQRGADVIAHGNYAHRLTVRTHDEIERLANQFNTMAESIEARDEELTRHRAQLEEMVAVRTAELLDERSKIRAIVDNVPSAFILLDPALQIRMVSAAFAQVTGLAPDRVLGQPAARVLADAGFCSEALCESAAREGLTVSHIDHVRTGNADRYLEHTAIPLGGDDGARPVLEIITDVTRRQRLEQQLIRSEKLMATGEMSAIIAHEFRNALTSVKMILQLQHESTALAEEERQALGVALDSVLHMESIVRELLSFARPSPLDVRPVAIAQLIDECRAFARLRIPQDRVALATEVEPGLPATFLDAARVKEAILNLVFNALQALEENPATASPAIRICARRTVLERDTPDVVPTADAAIGADPGGEMILPRGTACLVVSVADNGPGIDPTELGRIFDPFFTTKPNGTGLGLPMVKRTVNAHGGVVAVRAVPGGGAAFDMILPLRTRTDGFPGAA